MNIRFAGPRRRIVTTRAADGFERRGFSVADIFKMIEAGVIGDDEKFELIEGEIVPMSPTGDQHEIIKSGLTELLAAQKGRELRLGVEASVYLAEHTFVEPDLCLYPRGILPEDVKGTDILLAIEIAATRLRYDRGLKARLYAQHAIRELWVVDAVSSLTWRHIEPRADGSWGAIEEVAPDSELHVAAIPGLSIRMAALD